jgi:3-dehydroquinate dehydratase type I
MRRAVIPSQVEGSRGSRLRAHATGFLGCARNDGVGSCRIKTPAVVGVIASAEELRLAQGMRAPPDLFELRLDYLTKLNPQKLATLRPPLIITARHRAEGGKQIHFSRRDLLLRFLPRAQFIDVELRSLRELRDVWEEARRLKIKCICSVHHFARTPPVPFLQKQAQRAREAGADIFKLVTQADTCGDLFTLLQFLCQTRQRCSVMALGKFGTLSRLLFPECGSILTYAPLRRALYTGQLTLAQLRRQRDFYARK